MKSEIQSPVELRVMQPLNPQTAWPSHRAQTSSFSILTCFHFPVQLPRTRTGQETQMLLCCTEQTPTTPGSFSPAESCCSALSAAAQGQSGAKQLLTGGLLNCFLSVRLNKVCRNADLEPALSLNGSSPVLRWDPAKSSNKTSMQQKAMTQILFIISHLIPLHKNQL